MSHGLGILNITWKCICWRLYPQYLGDVKKNGHLPSPLKVYTFAAELHIASEKPAPGGPVRQLFQVFLDTHRWGSQTPFCDDELSAVEGDVPHFRRNSFIHIHIYIYWYTVYIYNMSIYYILCIYIRDLYWIQFSNKLGIQMEMLIYTDRGDCSWDCRHRKLFAAAPVGSCRGWFDHFYL